MTAPPAGTPSSSVVIIGADAERLRATLQTLPAPPRVTVLRDLYADLPALLAEMPQATWIDMGSVGDEDLGCLRALRRLVPGMRLALVTESPEHERVRRLAESIGARVITRPYRVADLLDVLRESEPVAAQTAGMAQVVRGLADEIGNPLMLATGYLQLVSLSVDRATLPTLAEQVELARAGLSRITRSLAKLRLLIEPARPVHSPGDPIAGLQRVVAELGKEAQARSLALSLPAPIPALQRMTLDHDRFKKAMELLLAAFIELSETGAHVAITAHEQHGLLTLRVETKSPHLDRLHLARAFDPYAPAQDLRGRDVGLNLPLARSLLAASGGTIELSTPAPRTLVATVTLTATQAGEGAG